MTFVFKSIYNLYICANFKVMLDFWSNVKSELEYRGISQKELAAEISESYNTLQSWINRDRLPNAVQAVRISRALGTTVEFLVTGRDEKFRADNTETIRLLEKAIENLR